MGKDFHPFNTTADWAKRGFHMRTPPLILASFDSSGEGDDRDALVMLAREEHQRGEPWDPDFAVLTKFRQLMSYRIPRHLEFPDKLAMLLNLHRQLVGWRNMRRSADHVFCVETNGVGYAMASSLRDKTGIGVAAYTTVANLSEDRYREKKLSMPRLAALDHLRVLFETHCYKVAPDAPGRKDFEGEVGSFVWAAPGRPEAIAGQHDDLIMAACGAAWIGAKVIPPLLRQQKFNGKKVH